MEIVQTVLVVLLALLALPVVMMLLVGIFGAWVFVTQNIVDWFSDRYMEIWNWLEDIKKK